MWATSVRQRGSWMRGSRRGSGYMEDVEPRPATVGRAASMLRRAVEIARHVVRGLKSLAVVAAACASLAWLVWLVDTPVGGVEGLVERIVALMVLLSPSAVLLVFLSGLRELARLSERMRALPADVRTELSSRPGSPAQGARGLLGSMFRLARLAWDRGRSCLHTPQSRSRSVRRSSSPRSRRRRPRSSRCRRRCSRS